VIEVVALGAVVAAALFFVSLGGASLMAPARARMFLLAFAGSRSKHYAELALRFIVGGAFVLSAPRLLSPVIFSAFGWVLLGTTAVLLLVPWRWHQRFAQRFVPEALRFLPLIGVCSLILGVLIIFAIVRGRVV
jgi:hypothetical protein